MRRRPDGRQSGDALRTRLAPALASLATLALAATLALIAAPAPVLAATGAPADVSAGDVSAGAAIVATRAELARVLDATLAAAFPGRPVRWELPREHPFQVAGARPFALTAPAGLRGGRNWFELAARDAAGGTYLLPVDISIQDSVWVATRALTAGRVLEAGDVRRELRWHAEAPEALAPDASPLGQRIVQALPATAVLLRAQLGPPPVVTRGAYVRLVYRSPGLFVATRAKVLEDGWAGGEIRVQPIDAHETCQALVRSAEEVEVIAP
jgi:flagella basal body P-ring formation protein FlgA